MQARANGITTFEVYASLNALPFYMSLGFSKLKNISVAMGSEISFPGISHARVISCGHLILPAIHLQSRQ
jgi:hypothetical protein